MADVRYQRNYLNSRIKECLEIFYGIPSISSKFSTTFSHNPDVIAARNELYTRRIADDYDPTHPDLTVWKQKLLPHLFFGRNYYPHEEVYCKAAVELILEGRLPLQEADMKQRVA